ncbi:MAG: methylated-DNA--[protein]-cysteine S-methyltransferase [Phycisphaerae bacterium]
MALIIKCPMVYTVCVESRFGPITGGYFEGRLMYLGFSRSDAPVHAIMTAYAGAPLLIAASARQRRDFEQIVRHIETRSDRSRLRLHAIGTPFQEEVWTQLLKIPYGKTITYKQLAEACGRPKALRAVAQACGANPIAVLIPCHRVIQSSGRIGGYHWGSDLKKALLAHEASLATDSEPVPEVIDQGSLF